MVWLRLERATRNPTSEIRNPSLPSIRRKAVAQVVQVQRGPCLKPGGAGADLIPDAEWHLKEVFDDVRIELAPGKLQYLRPRLFVAQGLAIGPVRRHHIQAVGNRKNACAERDLVFLQLSGIACAIVSLMMGE